MPRPKKRDEDILHEQLTALVTKQEKVEIEAYCKKHDVTISRLLRYAAKDYIKK